MASCATKNFTISTKASFNACQPATQSITSEPTTRPRLQVLFRERFARLNSEREAQLRAAFAQAGVDALELATDADIADTVIRFAELRKRRRGGRAHDVRVA